MRSRKRRSFFTIVILTAITLYAAAILPAYAAEENPTGEFAVAALNQYIWRGYELSRKSIVLQPTMTVAYKGFSANIWGNLDTKPYYAGTDPDKTYSSAWNETDITLSYTKSFGMLNIGAGYIYYSLGSLNSDAADRLDSQEIFFTVGLNTILSPTLTVYKEIDHYHNWYFLMGVSHGFALNRMISLNLAATASYLLSTDETTYPKFNSGAGPMSQKFSNFHEGALTVSLPIKPASYITLTPMVSYIFPLTGDAKNEMKGFGLEGVAPADRNSSFIVAGLTASFSF
ncbi:MAG: hypothetical protein JW943_15500 [Deltaproteobacteria bacterium]|nr:hypothetical protein [Deltaproteobacteria bacterium]